MRKKPSEIEKDKQVFIEKRLGILNRRVKTLEVKLFRLVVLDFISQLETDGGNIKNTAKNINLISRIDSIYKKFNKESQEDVAIKYANDLLKVGGFNVDYFSQVVDDSRESIGERVKGRNLRILGIDEVKGKSVVKEGGYIDNLINDTRIKTNIKRRGILAIQSGISTSELRRVIGDDLITSKRKEGLLKRYWRQNVYDTYSQFDRSTSKDLADQYKMQCAVWSLGEESDSRHICDKQNGKVYLREEIEELKDFANKKRSKKVIGPIVESVASYNPYIQQGGINCKHSWRWVSNREALRRDKTLYEEDGVIKRKEGGNPNKDI